MQGMGDASKVALERNTVYIVGLWGGREALRRWVAGLHRLRLKAWLYDRLRYHTRLMI